MIRALLADDEAASALLLREALTATGRVEVVGEAADGVACLQLMDALAPDVMFLDIQMAELNGLEVAEIALESAAPPLIVFITGFDMYAARAFELSAVDYVVKPADLDVFEERVRVSVDRVAEVLRRADPVPVEAVRDLLAEICRENAHLRPGSRLPVRDYDARNVCLVDPESVVYAENGDAGAVVHTRQGSYAACHSLGQLSQRLADRFFLATPGMLINLDYVSHVVPNGDGTCDVLLQVQRGELLRAVLVEPGESRELLGRLGL